MAETADWCPTPPETPEPQDLRQVLGCVPHALEHLGLSPYDLLGAIRQLLISHFAAADQIARPQLRGLVWRPTPDTGILIESVSRFNPATAEVQPALYVKSGGYRQHRVALNDQAETNVRGENRYMVLWVGSHTIFCLREEEGAAEILAHEVAQILTHYAPAIRQKAGMHRFQVVEVGAPRPVSKVRRSCVVPVTVGWAYEDAWVLTQEARPLNNVTIDVSPAL